MVLDSSFLISFFLDGDENFGKASAIFEKNLDEEMVIIDAVLFETLTVLNYKRGMTTVRTTYDQIVSTANFTIVYLTEDERKEILAEFLEQKKKMSFEDIAVVHACKKALSPVLSFDREIQKLLEEKRET